MPTTIFENGFEGQTDGTAVTVGNSGASGSAFTAVANGGQTYSAAAAVNGTRGLRVTLAASARYPNWKTSATDGRRVVARRSFVWGGSNPSGGQALLDLRTEIPSAAAYGVLQYRGASNQIEVLNPSFVAITASRFTLPSAGTYFVEFAAIASTTGSNGTLEYRLYGADGTTLLHSWSSGATLTMTQNLPNSARFSGMTSASGWTYDHMDDLRAMFTDDLTAWLGPLGASRVLTPVSGVSLLSVTKPTTLGGSDGTATVGWTATTDPDAHSYEVATAPGFGATSGFTTKATIAVGAPSPQTVLTGLEAGEYTVAVRVIPAP